MRQTTEQMALAAQELLRDALKHAKEDEQAEVFDQNRRFRLFYIVEDLREALKFLDYAVPKLKLAASPIQPEALATGSEFR